MAFKKFDFKTALDRGKKARVERLKEETALEEIKRQDQLDDAGAYHPPPEHGPDWRREMGELYGWPHPCGDEWGICIIPTKQQSRQIHERHLEACSRDDYGADYLKGEIAVSIDKTGRERPVTITNSKDYGIRHDMNATEMVVCRIRPRERTSDRAPTPAVGKPADVVRGQDRPVGGGPAPANQPKAGISR